MKRSARTCLTNTDEKQGFRRRMLWLLRFVIQQMAALLAGGTRDEVQPNTSNASLVKVSAIRARVLCPTCLGENDEVFRFCHFRGKHYSATKGSGTKTMHVDERAIDSRLGQFHRAVAALASVKRKYQTIDLFNRFLQSREGKGAKRMAAAQPTDVRDFVLLARCMRRAETHSCA